MAKYSTLLTFEELHAQIELSNILYNGTGPEPLYKTESINKQKIYRATTSELEKRNAALEWIDAMSNWEFETRLKRGALPDFVREELNTDSQYNPELVRLTNHPSCLLTEEALRLGCANQGYLNRQELRYHSIDEFKEEYYSNS